MINSEFIIKTLIVGESSVGKSSILERLTSPLSQFNSDMAHTVGLEFATYNVFVSQDDNTDSFNSNSTKYKLQIWDCAGQQRYFSIIRSYFRGSQIVMYVFDITDKNTFTSLHDWHKSVIKNIDCKHIPIVIGNKSDLLEHREVTTQEARDFAKSIGASYIETSAKDEINIQQAFRKPIHIIDDLYHKGLFELVKPKKEKESIKIMRMDTDEARPGCGKCF